MQIKLYNIHFIYLLINIFFLVVYCEECHPEKDSQGRLIEYSKNLDNKFLTTEVYDRMINKDPSSDQYKYIFKKWL